MLGVIAAFWGFTGICLLLGSAVWRLGSMALDMPLDSFDWYHWVALVLWPGLHGICRGLPWLSAELFTPARPRESAT